MTDAPAREEAVRLDCQQGQPISAKRLARSKTTTDIDLEAAPVTGSR
jgi:hypothetical protein